jgi:hypothetical protein
MSQTTSQSSTNELMSTLTQLHQSGQHSRLEFARQALTSWADTYSKNAAPQAEIEFLKEGKPISCADFFSAMNRPQAGRFIDELFTDVVPHMATQQTLLSDMARGYTGTGVRVHGEGAGSHAPLVDALAKVEALGADVQTEIENLTWVDDNLRTVTMHMNVEIRLDEQDQAPPAPAGRGIKF